MVDWLCQIAPRYKCVCMVLWKGLVFHPGCLPTFTPSRFWDKLQLCYNPNHYKGWMMNEWILWGYWQCRNIDKAFSVSLVFLIEVDAVPWCSQPFWDRERASGVGGQECRSTSKRKGVHEKERSVGVVKDKEGVQRKRVGWWGWENVKSRGQTLWIQIQEQEQGDKRKMRGEHRQERGMLTH